jgi:hypothetical protein
VPASYHVLKPTTIVTTLSLSILKAVTLCFAVLSRLSLFTCFLMPILTALPSPFNKVLARLIPLSQPLKRVK